MEIETQNNQALFHPLQSSLQIQTRYETLIYQIDVSFRRYECATHKLLLTKNSIFLAPSSLRHPKNQQNQIVLATKIDFELKFLIDFAEEDKPLTQKIGLTLFRNAKESCTLYCLNQYALQSMRGHLGRFINQKGFHSQFKPIKKLGKGNFASVYQVIRVEDGKKLAVKAFSKANTYNAENGKESLINELSIMRELSHKSKNILCLDAVYESDNSIYIVLELLEGKNLFEVVKEKNGKFSFAQVKAIMQGLLKGLKCMSENKIMHRDLKPENIMFRNSSLTTPQTYEPVIVDFGLAAHCEIVPYLFFRCGTPGFVAPEIIKIQQNEAYTSACDMFSVGCIFHLLTTNSPIFPGTKYEQVYKRNKMLQFNIKQQTLNKFNPFGMDMLERMIDACPTTRLTPAEALNNCFFVESKFDSPKEKQNDCMTNQPTSPMSYIDELKVNI